MADLAPGLTQVIVSAGGQSWGLPLEAVDHVDAITLASDNGPIHASTELCFRASTNDGARIVHAPWTYAGSGAVALAPDTHSNCTLVNPAGIGAGHVIAHAGGASLDVRVEVQP